MDMGIATNSTNRTAQNVASSAVSPEASRERKLASIQTISNLSPIENADAIEVARVLGWNVVVKKGEFSVGDECVYVEIDSVFPPDNPDFEFLTKGGANKRLKTVKLRGQVSQGICFSTGILPTGKYNRGDDVTELLGITKFDPPIPAQLAGQMKGLFPSFIQKTDEPRVQSLDHVLERFEGVPALATEKLDGASTTMYIKNGEFGVCSRNIELLETPESTLWQLSHRYAVCEALESEGRNLAIQGEAVGDGIQGNKYRLPKNDRRWYVYSIFDIDRYEYLGSEELKEICGRHGLLTVPEVAQFSLPGSSDELVEMSKGMSALNPQIKREGIVIRSVEETQVTEIGRLSVKAINPEYLLKYDE